MSLEQQQIEKVFQAALNMDEAERTVFLAEACPNDRVREEVERLLTGGELSENTEIATGETTEDRELDAMIGRQIGVYRLARELGRGGMGAVYLAERADGAFEQKVAVKLIKRGMDTDLVVRRFRNERQILATLNHPNITRLLDGGSTPGGLPYFVMEYVEGEQLYVYCDRRRLSINERLRIFQKICEAIEEAHRYKIIHRDLKPSNILVKLDGTPKLLDFGIAKLLDPEFGVTAMEPTATHLRMMTPQYASPEQISGEPVTPASDIYSLGVLLYELLTGHRPYRTKSRAPYEIARAIREEQPTRPSESLTREDNLARSDTGTDEKPTLDVIFASRGATFETLRHELAGNLDKIILKALRKNPLQRYQTAAELSEDITSYLEKRPIKAQSFESTEVAVVSTREQTIKNSIAILPFKLRGAAHSDETGDEYLSVGLADALVSRLSGVKRLTVRPTSSILRYADQTDAFQAGRELNVEFIVDGSIRRAGDRVRVSVQLLSVEENATRWAESFDEKMTDVLEIEDSISERVVKTLVSHLTGEEKNQLAKRGTSNAEAYEAYLRGRHHWNQFTVEGFARSLAFYQRAIELAPDYALAYAGIADYYNFLGVYSVRPFAETTAATKKAARQAIAFDPKLAEGYAALGFAAQLGDFDWEVADNYFRQAIELNPNYSIGRVWYSYYLAMSGRFDEAFAQVNKALELDPFTPIVAQTLSWVLYHSRRYDEAIASTYRLIEKEPRYGLAHLFLCGVLSRVGRHEEAIKIGHQAVALLGRSPHTLCWLASAYAAAGQHAQARALINEIENLSAAQYVSPYMLAMVYVNLGDTEKAFTLLDKALEIRDGRLSWLAVDPQFDALASDARYKRLLEAINHPSVSRQKTIPATTGGKEKSIAVLPLKMLGTRNEDDEYLGIGLTDALISRLSNIRLFIVRPTSSVLNYKENTDPFAAGGELNVDFVLDGNIRRVGERFRVSVQLLSVKENATRWAQNFDEKSSDILEFEDLISESVVKSLVPQLTGEEQQQLAKRATDQAEAYEAYLRGRFHWNLHSEEGFARAIQFYRRAVELDPNYALAYAAMTEYYIFLGIHCVIPFAEGAKPAREAAEKAVALDPTLAEGHAVLGFVEITYNWDWDAAEKHLRRAIELNPNSVTAHSWLNTVLSQRGLFDDALNEINRVIELDPDSILSLHLQAWVLYHARRFDESTAVHRKMLKNEPNYAWGLQTFSWVLRRTGHFAEAIACAEKSVQLTGENPFYLNELAAAYAEAGERDKAGKILARLREISATRFVSEYMLALVYCALGDKDKAFENLEISLATRDAWLNWLGVDPQFDVLRDDARFDDLLRRAGNPLAPPEESSVRLDTGGAKSIAVLPLKLFGTPTGAGDDEYLGIGLTDALITRLSNVRRFVMRPTSSVLQYTDTAIDPFEAGQKLTVDYVLDGNVRRSGERIRVTVQLLSIRENATVWAESFDEKSSDVLELEDLISEKVAQSLIPQLTGEERRKLEKRGTNNAEAYEAYLRGRFHWNQFTPDSLMKALNSYQTAINLDPNYALAYVGLADFYTWANIYGLIPSAAALEKSEASARRAIELDDQLGEAYAALGLHTQNMQRWAESERIFHRAVELNPNYPNTHEWYAAFLVGTRRLEEGVVEIFQAERLDPLSLRTKTLVAWTLYQAHHFEESLAKGREIIDLDPNYPQGYAQSAISLWALGRAEEALPFFERFAAMIPKSGMPLYQLCFGYVAVNRRDDARAVLREMQKLAAETYVKPYFLGMAHAALGERDEAFEYFEKSQAEFDPWLLWFSTEPMLDALRDDARYHDLLRRMNFPLIEESTK